MIINNKYIFVHIPKTGGSTIKYHLGERNYQERSHVKIKDVDFDNKFIFCFVRNPYDRLVSMYFSLIIHHKFKFIDFEDFVDRLHDIYPEDMYNEKEGESQYIIEQYKWIEDREIDFIGYENYEEDLRKVFKILNINIVEIVNQLETDHKSWEYYYTDELKEKVYNFYEKDFKKFNYKK